HFEEGVEYYKARRKALAFQSFVWAAAERHVGALCNIAVMLQTGDGVEPDSKMAMVFLSRAADLGHTGAIYNLGVLKRRRGNLLSEEAKAESLNMLDPQPVALDEGAAGSLTTPESRKINGESYLKQALDCFLHAAELEHVSALYNLGMMYYLGEGIPV